MYATGNLIQQGEPFQSIECSTNRSPILARLRLLLYDGSRGNASEGVVVDLRLSWFGFVCIASLNDARRALSRLNVLEKETPIRLNYGDRNDDFQSVHHLDKSENPFSMYMEDHCCKEKEKKNGNHSVRTEEYSWSENFVMVAVGYGSRA
ncbi:hypothetical protein GQ457_14G020690 [Hibiscus cannabinus]